MKTHQLHERAFFAVLFFLIFNLAIVQNILSDEPMPPVISSVRPDGILPAGTSAVNLEINTDENAMCHYSTSPYISYSEMSDEFSMRGTTYFYTTVSGLENGNTYFYYVKCTDSFSNTNQADYVIEFAVADDPSPSISDVRGCFKNGDIITVTGVNFGQKAHAAPLVWDAFENGISSEYLKDHSNWVKNSGNGAMYSDAQAFSGRLSAHNEVTVLSGTQFSTNHVELPPSNELYASYMFRFDVSGNKYGVLKMSRFASNYDGPLPHTDWYNGPGSTAWGKSSPDITVGGSTALYDSGTHVVQHSINAIPSLEWQRLEMYKKLSTPGVDDGEVFFARNGKIGWRDFSVPTRAAGFSYQLAFFTLGLMLANPMDDGVFRLYIDDVYVDDTLARVELSDEMHWEDIQGSGARSAIQIPVAWSDNSITFTANTGDFISGDSAYLYVVDENGNVNPTGYPVTIVDVSAPASPDNLHVQ